MVPGAKRNKRRRLKRHGFRVRMRTPGGRAVLKRRRSRGRHSLAPTLTAK